MSDHTSSSVISLPSGYHLEVYDELDSTSSEALRRAEQAPLTPLWIWARRQTAGRGRQGRTWSSSDNDLTCSLLLNLAKPPAECAQLTFVASLAVRDTLAGFDPAGPVTLKWPNDVLLGGAKVAGILLESQTPDQTGKAGLVIGIGVNISAYPPDTPYPATCLGQGMKMAPSSTEVFQRLVRAFAEWYETWTQKGFSTIRAAWLDHAHGLGQQITVKVGDKPVTGMFNSLTATGALDLKLTSGEHRAISAGEVFFDYPH